MRVNVIGLGYIGLPTALSMAGGGLDVVGTDKKAQLVDTLNWGKLTFDEKDMPALFERALHQGIRFEMETVEADVYIVAVPTPYDKYTKKLDPQYVIAAVKEILTKAPKGAVIAIESTIAIGTIDKEIRPLVQAAGLVCGKDIHLAHVPERIIPGNMIYELRHNNRTIGVDASIAGEILKEVYHSFCEGEMVITSIKVAEMTKVVENTSRDIQIAFANELSRICNREKIDVYEVIRIANLHPRVQVLSPGPGVGGHCISVDPWFFVGDYPDLVDVIRSARRVNENQPRYVISRIREITREYGIEELSQIGFYGLTYKENVDDTRESPAQQILSIMDDSLAFGVRVYDPYVKEQIVANQYMDFDEFLNGIKLVVVLVAHTHLLENADKLQNVRVYDTRNCLTGKNVIGL